MFTSVTSPKARKMTKQVKRNFFLLVSSINDSCTVKPKPGRSLQVLTISMYVNRKKEKKKRRKGNTQVVWNIIQSLKNSFILFATFKQHYAF